MHAVKEAGGIAELFIPVPARRAWQIITTAFLIPVVKI